MKYSLELNKEQLRLTLIMVENVIGQLEERLENDVNPDATNVVEDYQKSISFYNELYNVFEKQFINGTEKI